MTTNPCRRVRLPSTRLDTVEARFLTDEEADALARATPAHYKALVILLLGTGMRWSEATAVQTRHVDLAAGTVRVDQAWKRIPGQGYTIGVPKTNKARRTVNAAVMALAAVKPLLRKPDDFVFVTKSGGPVSHSNFLNNVWGRHVRRPGSTRVHDTRHTRLLAPQ